MSNRTHTYKDGKWVETIANTPSGGDRKSKVEPKTATQDTSKISNITGNPNATSTKVSDDAERDFKEIEENILEGDLSLRPNPNYKAKKTIKINGVGKYLSGLYFVESVTHIFSSNGGYDQSMKVNKNGFGGSLKKGVVPIVPPKPAPKPEPRPKAPVKPPVAERTYTMKKGDTLWAISAKYYGSGTHWKKIATANNIDWSKGEERRLQIGRVLKIPS